MGVRGLETFIEKHCPNACSKVDIAASLANYRQTAGLTPKIVVDGFSAHRYIYGDLPWLFGGQNREYQEKIIRFVEAFQDAGAELIFFFDGPAVPKKLDVWMRRRLDVIPDIYRVVDAIDEGCPYSYISEDSFSMIPSLVTLEYVTKEICKCKVSRSVSECDEEIAKYARENACFAILAQDTDFVIFEGALNYWTMKYFNLDELTCLEFNRKGLARSLQLDTSSLPLFASLCGNDHISYDSLKMYNCTIVHDLQLHNSFLNVVQMFHSKISRSRSYNLLFIEVARYVRTLPKTYSVLVRVLPRIAEFVFGDPSKKDLLKISIDTALAPATSEDANWNAIVELAFQRHLEFKLTNAVFLVLPALMFQGASTFADYRDPTIPPYHIVTRPLRLKWYGILLHEKPKSQGPVQVNELIMFGPESFYEAHFADPVYPLEHPGLLTLWKDDGDSAMEARWTLLAWCFDTSADKLRAIPARLLVPTLAVQYLLGTSVLTEDEARVFLTAAVILPSLSLQQLADLPTDPINKRAVFLSSLFLITVFIVQMIMTALNGPITMVEMVPLAYCDGKLTHTLFIQKFGTLARKVFPQKIRPTCEQQDQINEIVKHVLAP